MDTGSVGCRRVKLTAQCETFAQIYVVCTAGGYIDFQSVFGKELLLYVGHLYVLSLCYECHLAVLSLQSS